MLRTRIGLRRQRRCGRGRGARSAATSAAHASRCCAQELLHLLEGSLDASTPIAVLLNKVDLPVSVRALPLAAACHSRRAGQYAVDKGAAVSALGLEPFLAASTADAPAHAHAGAAAAAAAGDAPGPQPTPVVEDMEDGVVDGRCVAVFRTSVTRGTGVLEAMQWVAARM